jgi:hypothetical protein
MPFIYTLKSSTERKCPWIVVNRIHTQQEIDYSSIEYIFVTYWYPRRKKKESILAGYEETRQSAVFFKRILFFRSSISDTRVHITTVWIMTMIVCGISSIPHTPTLDATVQYKWWLTFFFIFLLLSLLSIRRDEAAAAVHIHLIRVDVHLYINVIWTNQWAHTYCLRREIDQLMMQD